jgi:hypothetical protein
MNHILRWPYMKAEFICALLSRVCCQDHRMLAQSKTQHVLNLCSKWRGVVRSILQTLHLRVNVAFVWYLLLLQMRLWWPSYLFVLIYYVTMNDETMIEKIVKCMEGSGCDLILGTILSFVQRDWGKPQEFSRLLVSGLRFEPCASWGQPLRHTIAYSVEEMPLLKYELGYLIFNF